jgi:predicted NBD/HSP70 family sugar kinase
VVEMAERLVGEADAPVLGVGVGSPGLVSADGTVRQASNLGWEELALRERLETTLGLPGVVANDASAAALADMERGETNASILVVLGEGVGAGLVMGGELFGGEHSAAGELGHVVVEPNGAICSCGNRGCLETVASVPAILRALNAPTDLDPGPDLEDLRRRFGPDRVDVVLSSVGMRVADVLAPIVAMLDLARVRIAVEIQGAAEVVAASAEVVLRSRLLPAVSRVLRVEATGKVDDLVLAGAAGLVARRRLGVVP